MDLVADFGNTRSHLAAFEKGSIRARAAFANGTEREMVAGWQSFAASLPARPARVGVASVNPAVLAPFVAWVKEKLGLEARVLGENLAPGIPLDVDEPSRVGADRLVDALWAARSFPGRAAVVIDCGTAITFNVVSSKGVFVGGAIAPGLGTQARALAEKTALLPLVSVTRAPAPIGRSTKACIEAGIFFGAVGLVDALCARIEDALGEKLVVVATGGDAELVASGSRRIERVVPDVTLEGVALALGDDGVVESRRP